MKKYLLLTTILCSPVTFAASGDSYFGGGYHLGKYEENGFPTANPTALKLEYGQYISDSIAIEGHFALGLGEDTVSYLGFNVDIEMKQAISVFVKGDVKLNESVNLYGLLGLTKGKIEASIPAFNQTVTEDDSGLSYGVGIESKTASGVIFSAEYIMYLSEDAYEYSGFNFGIAKTF